MLAVGVLLGTCRAQAMNMEGGFSEKLLCLKNVIEPPKSVDSQRGPDTAPAKQLQSASKPQPRRLISLGNSQSSASLSPKLASVAQKNIKFAIRAILPEDSKSKQSLIFSIILTQNPNLPLFYSILQNQNPSTIDILKKSIHEAYSTHPSPKRHRQQFLETFNARLSTEISILRSRIPTLHPNPQIDYNIYNILTFGLLQQQLILEPKATQICMEKNFLIVKNLLQFWTKEIFGSLGGKTFKGLEWKNVELMGKVDRVWILVAGSLEVGKFGVRVKKCSLLDGYDGGLKGVKGVLWRVKKISEVSGGVGDCNEVINETS
jgi:hypothetical protein